MSLRRLVLRYGVVGGGSALVGLACSEGLGIRNGVMSGFFVDVLARGLIGGAIGAGMNLAAGRSGPNRVEMARLALAGLVIGGFAGAIGASFANALCGTLHGTSFILGWAIMGGGIGAAEGLYKRSTKMLREGVAAGVIGGLAGGLAFGGAYTLLSRFSEGGSRAVAFALFGSCLGVSMGLGEAAFAGLSRFYTWKKSPRPAEKADEPIASPQPIAPAKPDPVVPAKPKPVAPAKPNPVVPAKPNPVVPTRPNPVAPAKPSPVATVKPNPVSLAKPNPLVPTKRNPLVPAKPNLAAEAQPSPKPVQPAVQNGITSKSTGMTPCPMCGRSVPGTRPYCVVCEISF